MVKRIFQVGEAPDDKFLIGGKGASLNMMTKLGLPVPPGFTIVTSASIEYLDTKKWPDKLEQELHDAVAVIEKKQGRTFGSESNPLLVSVRSGAPVSLPGMMDTILNIGLNDDTVQGLAATTSNIPFAYDTYKRFIQLYGSVVLEVPSEEFEELESAIKTKYKLDEGSEFTALQFQEICVEFKKLILAKTDKTIPHDVWEQLRNAINAVFKSWINPRASKYRDMYNIPYAIGTAVTVQAMVFGNYHRCSGTGVGFTRDPATGIKAVYGEFLPHAQGEDVVAGIKTPLKLDEMLHMPGKWPKIYDEIRTIYTKLEKHYKDMVDVEFTIENEKLYILQARIGKRTGMAMLRIAIDLVREGILTKEQAILSFDPLKINELLFKTFDSSAPWDQLCSGLPASPGAACGQVVFNTHDAIEEAKLGNHVILVRRETSPEDLLGIDCANGLLTARGGITSHAAVIARGMGKCCVSGVTDLHIDEANNQFVSDGRVVRKGDWISLNGASGNVAFGKVPLVEPDLGRDFKTIMEWANSFKKLKVMANADTPRDAKAARDFGAEGLGLCRTEHMFFSRDRILAMREMILAQNHEQRTEALNKILPLQINDFYEICKVMDGLPAAIRLFDPPLHEFLPKTRQVLESIAEDLGVSEADIAYATQQLREVNPMLGFRGCRLGILYPEITEMQIRAILTAAIKAKHEGITIEPQIMVPLVMCEAEVAVLRKFTENLATKIFTDEGTSVNYKFGTMIELPRACIQAKEIAKYCDFFSFGTNDLTQTALGISRDDSGRFLPFYLRHELLLNDPFQILDVEGVGELVRLAKERGLRARSDLETNVCGEHGAEPSSIKFFHDMGIQSVSCTPYRVPVAIIAAAQAALKDRIYL